MDESHKHAAELFTQTWLAILTRIGGWSDAAAREWIADQQHTFNSVWFLHDSPLRFAANALLPEPLRQIHGMDLRTRVEDAILPSGGTHIWHPDRESDFDWEAARQRVQNVIQELEREYRMGSP